MDAGLLQLFAGGGLAGLALAAMLWLYRDIVAKNIFPTLTKTQAFRLLVLIALLFWSVAMAAVFVSVNGPDEGKQSGETHPEAGTIDAYCSVVGAREIGAGANVSINCQEPRNAD